jgi:hypothetical protein
LNELGEERVSEVESWIQQSERMERMKAEYAEIVSVIERHKKSLVQVENQAKATLDVVRAYEDFIHTVGAGIKRIADATILDTDSMIMAERKLHLTVFRRYYLTLGDLLYKKELRLQELDRMMRQIDQSIAFCVETFDPALQKYREQRKELDRIKNEVSKKVTTMRQNGSKAASDFAATEDFLIAHGLQFTSPVIEMQEHLVEKKSMVLKMKKSVQEKEKAELEAESTGFESLNETTKQAKLTGMASLITPLTADPPPAKFKKLESYS